MSLHFQLVTPEKVVLSQELTSLSCPTAMGEITILPGHAPLVANLVAGELHAKTTDGDSYIFVAGGFVEVKGDNKVVVLADAAEHHHEIDIEKTQEAINRAKQALEEERLTNGDLIRAIAALESNMSRLHIAKKHSSKRGVRAHQEPQEH